MKIVIAGGTGFLGRTLAAALVRAGHDIVVLTRRAAGSVPVTPRTTVVSWNPDDPPGPWGGACTGASAIVNLAGESIGAGRWNAARKRRLLESRTRSTASLVRLIGSMTPPPGVLVSASAVGYYGDCGDRELTEEAPAGSDFLAQMALQWEAAALRAASASTRVACIRTGLVLDPHEGALVRMLPPFRLGLGGPFGSGRQYMSWIHRDDWTRLVSWVIATPDMAGPVNGTAPRPVTNAEFARALGAALKRPVLLPAPAFALRIALGEMADSLLLFSQRVRPARALAAGFRFDFETLDRALDDVLR